MAGGAAARKPQPLTSTPPQCEMAFMVTMEASNQSAIKWATNEQHPGLGMAELRRCLCGKVFF
jgi:hypothetical protein